MTFEGRRNNFDFLRFAFAGLVIFSHCFYLLTGRADSDPLFRVTQQIEFGHLAVDGFFVISGFLITASWLATPHAGSFFRKRIARIFPGFIVACAVGVLVVGPLGAGSAAEYFRQFRLGPVIVQTLTLGLPPTPPTFTSHTDGLVNRALWTIRYEFLCYLLTALLGLAGVLRRRIIMLAGMIALFGLWSLSNFLKRPLIPNVSFCDVDSISLFRFVVFYGMGMCFYLYRKEIPLSAMGFAGCIAALLASALLHKVMYFALPLFGTYALLYFAFHPRWDLHRFGRRADISYGLYLYGWPVQQLCLQAFGARLNSWQLLLIAFPLAVVAGLLSWFLIERPCLAWAHRRRAAPPIVAARLAPASEGA